MVGSKQLWTWLAAVGVLGLLVGGSLWARRSQQKVEGPLRLVASSTQAIFINDSADALEFVSDASLPPGVERVSERVGKDRASHYIRMTLGQGESLELALTRVGPWLQTLPRPPGATFVWGPVQDSGEPADELQRWRSYLISEPPFLVESDFRDAALVESEQTTINLPAGGSELIETKEWKWGVRLRLRSAGEERWRRVQRAKSRHRLALIVGGHVVSAPRVSSEIDDSDLVISLGTDLNRAESRLQAERLLQAIVAAR